MAAKTAKKVAKKAAKKAPKSLKTKVSDRIAPTGKDKAASRGRKSQKFYSVDDIMELEGVSRRTVYEWISTKKIVAQKSTKAVEDFDAGEWMIPTNTYKRPPGMKRV